MRPEQIIQRTAVLFDLTPAELTGPSRARHIVAARQAAMLALAERTDLSLVAIGQLFDRDHTTVLHGIAAARKRAQADAAYAERIAAVLRRPEVAQPVEPLRDKLRRAALKIGALDSGEQYWTLEAFGFFRPKASV